jgi:hypothetical protein
VRLVSRSASFTRLFMRILSPLICQRTSGYVDRSDRVLRCGYLPIHSEAEYSVPIERAAYYCGALMEMIERQRHKMNMCPEVRFVAKDNIWMSGAEGSYHHHHHHHHHLSFKKSIKSSLVDIISFGLVFYCNTWKHLWKDVIVVLSR